jgi:hypothetical protein
MINDLTAVQFKLHGGAQLLRVSVEIFISMNGMSASISNGSKRFKSEGRLFGRGLMNNILRA